MPAPARGSRRSPPPSRVHRSSRDLIASPGCLRARAGRGPRHRGCSRSSIDGTDDDLDQPRDRNRPRRCHRRWCVRRCPRTRRTRARSEVHPVYASACPIGKAPPPVIRPGRSRGGADPRDQDFVLDTNVLLHDPGALFAFEENDRRHPDLRHRGDRQVQARDERARPLRPRREPPARRAARGGQPRGGRRHAQGAAPAGRASATACCRRPWPPPATRSTRGSSPSPST